MAEPSLETTFKAATVMTAKSKERTASNTEKLAFYALFKQATEGPCVTSAPSRWNVVARAKWDAWHELGNMSKQDAMRRYVDSLTKLSNNWRASPLVADVLTPRESATPSASPPGGTATPEPSRAAATVTAAPASDAPAPALSNGTPSHTADDAAATGAGSGTSGVANGGVVDAQSAAPVAAAETRAVPQLVPPAGTTASTAATPSPTTAQSASGGEQRPSPARSLRRMVDASDGAAEALSALVEADAARILDIETRLSKLLSHSPGAGSPGPVKAEPALAATHTDSPQDLVALCASLQRTVREQQTKLDATHNELSRRIRQLEAHRQQSGIMRFLASMWTVRYWKSRRGPRTVAVAIVLVTMVWTLRAWRRRPLR